MGNNSDLSSVLTLVGTVWSLPCAYIVQRSVRDLAEFTEIGLSLARSFLGFLYLPVAVVIPDFLPSSSSSQIDWIFIQLLNVGPDCSTYHRLDLPLG